MLSNLIPILLIFRLFFPLVACQPQVRVPEVMATVDIEPYEPTDVAVNSKTGEIYILSAATHVAVLKGTEQIASLPTGGRRSINLAVDEERGWVYVVNQYTHDVTVIRNNEVITNVKPVGLQPQNVALSQDGLAYVASGYEDSPDGPIVAGNVTVISGTQVMGSIPLGHEIPTKVLLEPISGDIYIGGVGGKVIVLRGMEEVARFDIDSPIKALDVNPRTGEVYALNHRTKPAQQLHLFKDAQLIKSLEVQGEGGLISNMRVHPVTGDVYVVDPVRQEVVVVRENEVIARIPAGLGAEKMVIDPVTGNVYVANYFGDDVTVIHGTKVIATIDVGWYPFGIGVNPANGWVYVSNTNDGTVTVLGFPEAFERRGSLMRQPVAFR
jgi:YVTN family beta-propeller protein